MKRNAAIAALATLFIAVAVAAFLTYFHRVPVQVPVGMHGEPTYNELYVLEHILRTYRQPVRTRASLDWRALAPTPGDTLVFDGGADLLDRTRTAQVLAWVALGGHLVIEAPASSAAPGLLAEAIGLRPLAADDDQEEAGCQHLRIDEKDTFALCGPRFQVAPGQDGRRFARIQRGRGTITVVSSLRFLHNRSLEEGTARQLAYQALAPGFGHGRFLLVYRADPPSLWRLLVEAAWPALVALSLALLAWLAWRSQNLGPRLPRPAPHRRALLDHVRASGEFIFRRRRGAVLHAAMLSRFRRRLAQREPTLAALDGQAQIAALATRLRLAPEDLGFALAPYDLSRPDHFVRAIATLAQMRARL